jgi:hypothetical protein
MKDKLTKEERDLLRSFERREWKPVPDAKKEIARHRAYAKAILDDFDSVMKKIGSSKVPNWDTV